MKERRTRKSSARTHDGTSIANWTICEAVRYFFHHTLRPSVATWGGKGRRDRREGAAA